MKVLFLATIALFCLLLEVNAQTPAISIPAMDAKQGILANSNTSLTEPTATSDFDQSTPSTPLIEDALGLPVMRDQLTITESSQNLSLNIEDIGSSYGKMMQDFGETLANDATGTSIGTQASKSHPLINILVGFIIEVVTTLIVLKIAFLIGEFRYRLSQVLPISLAVAFVGALLSLTLNISLFNPIQISLSSLIMLMLIRFMTEAHEWPTALQMTLVARLVAIGLAWLAFTGMAVFGL